MQRLFSAIVKRRRIIIIAFVCLAVVSAILMLGVGQNYDMAKYLPGDSESNKGIDILKEQYSYNGNAVIMLENVDIAQVLETKHQIEEIDGIENVVWLDDITDIKEPAALIDSEIRDNYLIGSTALMQIIFTDDDYARTTHQAIDNIKVTLGGNALLSGSAVDAYGNINAIGGSILTGILVALAIVFLILMLATDSFFEVVLFIITIGIAILLNMGTNVIFGEISYMTFASAAILQLAISMDYSIFLLHRFNHERKNEPNSAKAMVVALRASLSSILSSGMTTIVGFIALVFMSYTMGTDMGLVLAKGIVFSLLSVLVLLPCLAVGSVKLIDKTTHKRFLPSLKKIAQVISGKAKFVVLALLAIVAVISFMAQSNNDFLYASNSVGDDAQAAVDEHIEETFGTNNLFVVLVPRGSEIDEYHMASDLGGIDNVSSVQGLYTLVDPTLPGEIVPDYIRDEFLSEKYSRYIVEVDAQIESDKALTAVEDIRTVSAKWFDVSYLTGATPVVYDIKHATSGDFSLVSILSIVFVGIILLITFRSLTVPIILLFVIQTSIWINMAIPYFAGTPMVFIGYMIISAVQLGATIDYAILMTNYYFEGRMSLEKRQAGIYAAEKAGASILMSSMVLASAGFVVAATFTQQAMSQLGLLIGRGAILSGVLTIVVLPQLLILFDKAIMKTTLKRKRLKGAQ